MKTAIIIPALNPDKRLINVIEKLNKMSDSAIVIINDGSLNSCHNIFYLLENTCNCIVCHHTKNKGKGEALKTGIRRAMREYPELLGIVTADADGQHLPEDIVRVADELPGHPESLILGSRDFSLANVPFKSRWGNRITSFVFYLGTRIRCPDTQTGLRGIPASLFELCLSVPGSRFEYEMNVLIASAKKNVPFVTLPISTVYHENNIASHFHAFKDSARIYFNILKFGISSLTCAAVDLTVFSLLMYSMFGRSSSGIFAATAMARCISGLLNFTLNKKWCFESHGDNLVQAVKYFALFCAQLTTSWAIVTILSRLPVNITVLKMLTDSGLFVLSYFIQKNFIFRNKSSASIN